MRRKAALLAVLAVAAIAVPAAPASAAACSQGGGVTVVVDFASLGGGTPTRCAAGNPSSGLAALRGAGFQPTRAAQEPGYFLCRIDGKPANDPCQRTSPADAYWSYWHAKPGGSWSFSDTGAADYDPAPGTVEGWAFGAGKPPSSSPPQAQAASPAAGSQASKPAGAPSSRPANPSAAVVQPSTAGGPSVGPTAAATGSVGPVPSPSAFASPSASPAELPGPTALADPAGGSPAPARGSAASLVVAALVIAVLAAAGGRLAWRRRTGRVG
jgi:hypothetical protein